MSVISSKLVSSSKPVNRRSLWLGKNKEKWVSRGLIGIVIAYVALTILAPLVALALGAFENGIAAIFEAFDHSFVLTSFWNTLWISLIVVIIHAVFGTIVSWVFVR